MEYDALSVHDVGEHKQPRPPYFQDGNLEISMLTFVSTYNAIYHEKSSLDTTPKWMGVRRIMSIFTNKLNGDIYI